MSVDPRVELAILNAAQDSMGMYPESTISEGVAVPRTDWQDGWNACMLEIAERRDKFWTFHEQLPPEKKQKIEAMLIAEAVFLTPKEGGDVGVYFLTSDLFAWGYADCEEVTDDLLGPLYDAFAKNGHKGMLACLCKREKKRPQWPVEKTWREAGIWDNELESLPARC